MVSSEHVGQQFTHARPKENGTSYTTHFANIPTIHVHDSIPNNPAYWNEDAGHWRGAVERTIPPDHPLHTTQDYYYGHSENHFITHPGAEGSGGLPYVGHVNGMDVIADGHHRIVADRLAGRPTRVMWRAERDRG